MSKTKQEFGEPNAEWPDRSVQIGTPADPRHDEEGERGTNALPEGHPDRVALDQYRSAAEPGAEGDKK